MFTGIVQSIGTLLESSPTAAGKRLTVSLGELAPRAHAISLGDSVCVAGVCLTAIAVSPTSVSFDVITETLNRSSLGSRKPGDSLNLELSLQPSSFVGGHFLQGHIDAVGRVAALQQNSLDWRITISFPSHLAPCIVPKGSIAVEGVSMTLAEVDTHANTFTLAVIPTTLQKTTLTHLRINDPVNIETDILARTVVHYLNCMHNPSPTKPAPDISLAKLQQLGFA